MLDRWTVELVLISLLAAFCGGLAWLLIMNCLLWLLPQLRLRELSVLWPLWWAPADHDAPSSCVVASPGPSVGDPAGGSGRLRDPRLA